MYLKMFTLGTYQVITLTFTQKSLEYLSKKYKLKIIGEWWHGADIPDLFRSILISSKHLDKKIYTDSLNKNLYSVIDDLQNVLIKIKFLQRCK